MFKSASEHDYIGLSELPSMEPSDKGKTRDNENALNLKATELRLGLPGSESPDRVDPGFLSLKSCYAVSEAERVFSDAIRGSGKWVFSSGSTDNSVFGSDPGPSGLGLKDGKVTQLGGPAGPVQEKKDHDAHGLASASKAQLVGWPPVRSFRKNTMASHSQKNGDDDSEAKSGQGCLFVKVSMKGAPYLRKIDLNNYKSYFELSSALEKMFGCFTIGQCGSHGEASRDGSNETSRLTDLLRVSEYVLTYEDKDGDWMLVGDVPWQMFTDTCKRLRIMKSSEAIGLTPRAVEKCKSHN